jgi:hypothetical protein
MMKSLLSTAALAAMLMGAAPAFAADCATGMKATNELVIKATDSAKKTAAMKHMALANEKMTAKDEAACQMHLGDAAKALQ